MPWPYLCGSTPTPHGMTQEQVDRVIDHKCGLVRVHHAGAGMAAAREWVRLARCQVELALHGARGLRLEQVCWACAGDGVVPGMGHPWERPCYVCNGRGYTGDRST